MITTSKRKSYIIIAKTIMVFAMLFFRQLANGQVIGKEDESRLYASTKQVNQFFRRFNGEENEKGDRLYSGNKQYRSEKLRKKYLSILFDTENKNLDKNLIAAFARDVIEKHLVLDFHKPGWFSEVEASFLYNGEEQNFALFMQLEKHMQGTRWAISKAYTPAFEKYFDRDTTKVGRFLHPLSHELAFMNFRKAFNNPDSISQFAVKKFRPDWLTLFLYELKQGHLSFKSVLGMKFHFFQVPGWYFEITEYNRPGYNTGWLISNLVRLNNDTEKKLLERHLYNEQ